MLEWIPEYRGYLNECHANTFPRTQSSFWRDLDKSDLISEPGEVSKPGFGKSTTFWISHTVTLNATLLSSGLYNMSQLYNFQTIWVDYSTRDSSLWAYVSQEERGFLGDHTCKDTDLQHRDTNTGTGTIRHNKPFKLRSTGSRTFYFPH